MYVNHNNIEKEALTLDDFNKFVNYWPSQDEFPKALIKAVYDKAAKNDWSSYRENSYYFIAQDLNEDGDPDYVVIEENNYSTSAKRWFLKEEQWQFKYMKTSNPNDNKFIKDYLLNNQIEVIKPKWNNLKVGDLTFSTSKN